MYEVLIDSHDGPGVLDRLCLKLQSQVFRPGSDVEDVEWKDFTTPVLRENIDTVCKRDMCNHRRV